MLEQIRKQARSSIVLLLFGFIIFVFVFSFGAGSVGFRTGGCGTSNAAAIVNGETVTLTDFNFVRNLELQQLMQRRKQGQPIRKEEKLQLNIRVLDQLIDQRLLSQTANGLGLRVTDEERKEDIRSQSWFLDKDGNFDFKRYKNIVQWHFKTSMKEYEEFHRQQMLIGRMADIIQATARVTEEELQQAYAMRETKVNLEYVNLGFNIFKIGFTPSDEEIDAFEKENLDRVEEFYNSHDSRFHKPKKVEVAHVFWRVENEWSEDQVTDKRERAELTLDDLDKGEDFVEQAKDYSEDVDTREKYGELGTMTMETMTARWGAPFAEAAIALEEGKHSKVVRSDKGFHVIKCLKVIPAVDRKLDEVKREIARELLVDDQANAKVEAEADRLLSGMKEGKTLEELIEKDKPPPAEIEKPDEPAPLSPASLIRARKTGPVARMAGFIPQLGLDKDLARAAFELTEDKPIPDKVWKVSGPMGGDSYVVFRLIEQIPPDMSKFDEVKAGLSEQMLSVRRQRQLTSWLERKRSASTIEVNEQLRAGLDPLAVGPRQNR